MSIKEMHVYVVLSDTGTLFTRMIRLYTGAQYNHASIAFDPNLNEIYSFGRKNPRNPFIGGFVKENIRSDLFRNASYEIYRCTVSASQYRKIRGIIREFERDAQRYKYNLSGLLGIMLNIPVNRDRSFFCSQFVASVFEQAGAQLVPKCPALTTPSDLERSQALKLMFAGKLQRSA
jgi:hypothetical protein